MKKQLIIVTTLFVVFSAQASMYERMKAAAREKYETAKAAAQKGYTQAKGFVGQYAPGIYEGAKGLAQQYGPGVYEGAKGLAQQYGPGVAQQYAPGAYERVKGLAQKYAPGAYGGEKEATAFGSGKPMSAEELAYMKRLEASSARDLEFPEDLSSYGDVPYEDISPYYQSLKQR
jgi:hypothetical protein